MQLFLVSLILVLCVAYAARRLWQRLTAPPQDVRCAGCPLADGCQHRHNGCCGTGNADTCCCNADSAACQKVYKTDNMS